MHRRAFLAGLATTPALPALTRAVAAAQEASGSAFVVGPGPYGSLEGIAPDANGIILPEGFTSRVIATSTYPIGDTDVVFGDFPDGGATVADPDPDNTGGWIHVRNSEADEGHGGVYALRFDSDGALLDARQVLADTSRNCAGGVTPWGTWLSCEEVERGQVYEVDPTGATDPVLRPLLGTWNHEAAAVDPTRGHVYLSEDETDGRFYRFTPKSPGDLSDGTLEVAVVAGDGLVTWEQIPDPAATDTAVRDQVGASMPFNGGEGLWFDVGQTPTDDRVLLTTKGDNRVWSYAPESAQLSVLYDATLVAEAPLTGVDNLVVSPGGDIVVAEDAGNMELVMLTPEGEVAPLLRVVGQDGSELTGPSFTPDGSRLIFASQRGTGDFRGILYEVRGPFRTSEPQTTASTLAAAGGSEAAAGAGASDDAGRAAAVIAGVLAAGAAIAGGVVALRHRVTR